MERCEKDCWHDDDRAAVVQIGLSQLISQLALSSRCMFVGRLRSSLSHACERISADIIAHPVRINASDFCLVERERLFWLFHPL